MICRRTCKKPFHTFLTLTELFTAKEVVSAYRMLQLQTAQFLPTEGLLILWSSTCSNLMFCRDNNVSHVTRYASLLSCPSESSSSQAYPLCLGQSHSQIVLQTLRSELKAYPCLLYLSPRSAQRPARTLANPSQYDLNWTVGLVMP